MKVGDMLNRIGTSQYHRVCLIDISKGNDGANITIYHLSAANHNFHLYSGLNSYVIEEIEEKFILVDTIHLSVEEIVRELGLNVNVIVYSQELVKKRGCYGKS